jgi:predicted nucleotidyltransferase
MLSKKSLQNAISAIIDCVHPLKVILFGSYARQEADEGSDIDLLIIEEKTDNKGMEMVKIRNAIGDIGVGVDILVYTAKDVQDRGHLRGSVLYWALKEGKVLYEKTS